jgi:hypothetical protein
MAGRIHQFGFTCEQIEHKSEFSFEGAVACRGEA